MLQSDIHYGVLSRAEFGFGPGSGLELKKKFDYSKFFLKFELELKKTITPVHLVSRYTFALFPPTFPVTNGNLPFEFGISHAVACITLIDPPDFSSKT